MRHHVANWRKSARNDASQFSVTLHLGAPKPSTVRLRAVGGDITILYEVFAEQAYWIPDTALPTGSVAQIVDCGAHIGLTALYFAYRYPRARIVAIEPSPTNFELLLANTVHEPRIVAIQACVSDRAGVSRISLDGPGWGHRIGSTGTEVVALTLQNIRESCGIDTIDVLKLDVEGAEKAVLASGVGNTRVIAAELHDDYTIERFARDVAPRRVATRKGHDPVFALPEV
jgi:FkbM family methyltransferase